MRITAAESRIMDALWRKSPLSTEEIVSEVGPAEGWAEGTVRTLINRLLKKKAVRGEREGVRYHYLPMVQRSDYVLSESQGLLDRLFDGEVTPLIAHFARHRALTPEDMKKLKRLVAELDDDSHDFLLDLGRINLLLGGAILAVLVLRKPARQLFGASVAYSLWFLAPAAVLASFLPARQVAAVILPPPPALPPIQTPLVAFDPSAWTVAIPVPAQAIDWTGIMLLAWLAGIALGLGLLVRRQRAFLAEAARGELGPAVVGFLAPRIVTPSDFEERFSAEERAMILAHERMHLSRQDARINALVVLAQCLCWFNPLLHVGAYFLRMDQEIACDAAVQARHPGGRRAYAEALVKSQLAHTPLPLGCYWPARTEHPLTERIAMLKRPAPGRIRLFAGAALLSSLAFSAGYAVWAAEPPVELTAPAAAPAPIPLSASDPLANLGADASAVFGLGADPSLVLTETDHGVKAPRTLKIGDEYRDGWKITAIAARTASLSKGGQTRTVELTGLPQVAATAPASQMGKAGAPELTNGAFPWREDPGLSPELASEWDVLHGYTRGQQPPSDPVDLNNHIYVARGQLRYPDGRTVSLNPVLTDLFRPNGSLAVEDDGVWRMDLVISGGVPMVEATHMSNGKLTEYPAVALSWNQESTVSLGDGLTYTATADDNQAEVSMMRQARQMMNDRLKVQNPQAPAAASPAGNAPKASGANAPSAGLMLNPRPSRIQGTADGHAPATAQPPAIGAVEAEIVRLYGPGRDRSVDLEAAKRAITAGVTDDVAALQRQLDDVTNLYDAGKATITDAAIAQARLAYAKALAAGRDPAQLKAADQMETGAVKLAVEGMVERANQSHLR